MIAFRDLILEAVAKRQALAATTMYRLFDGHGDGYEGIWIDRYGPVAVIHSVQDELPAVILEDIIIALESLSIQTIYHRPHQQPRTSTVASHVQLLYGTAKTELLLQEHGINYIIQPQAHPYAGLFLDMRDVRQQLQAPSPFKRVLNTFCFTGSLGLSTLVGGADEVTQLDNSRKALNWAKQNLAANPGCQGKMRFICEDVRRYLGREVKRQSMYQRIILDPPTFGHGHGKPFVLESALAELLQLSYRCLASPGEIWLTTNCQNLGLAHLQRQLRRFAHAANRRILQLRILHPPAIDFTSPLPHPYAMHGYCVSVE